MSFDWDVIRTTTDKLVDVLNDLAWEVHQIQYTGGRDWVIICRQPAASGSLGGSARRSLDGSVWEIEIPSIGPNKETLKLTAMRVDDIQPLAQAAIARALGVALEEIDVEIDIDTRAR